MDIQRLGNFYDPEFADFRHLLGDQDAITPEIQRAVWAAKGFHPCEIYCHAPAALRDGLISALMSTENFRKIANLMSCPAIDLHELMGGDEMKKMAERVEGLRKELYMSAGSNRSYHVKVENMKQLLPDWEGAEGCISANRMGVEGCKVGDCCREEPDGDWDSGWRFTAGDESGDCALLCPGEETIWHETHEQNTVKRL